MGTIKKNEPANMQSLDTSNPIWDRFYTVNPLVVVGTLEEDESIDLAPKHMAFPMGWKNYFGFVCTPAHATYQNIKRDKAFSVSYPKPTQLIITSLTASPRCEDNTKPILKDLPTVESEIVNAQCLKEAYIHLECTLEKIVDGFGSNSLIVGKVIVARVDKSALRREDRDDQDVIFKAPLLTYLNPGRYTIISKSHSFPFPKDFSK